MNLLFKNTLLYAIGEIIPRALSFILLPIFTKHLTPADYGILSYTNSVVMFLFVLTSLSLNTYILRYYFEYTSEESKKKLIGNIFLFISGFNLLILLIMYYALPPLISAFNIQVPWEPYFRLAILNNFLEIFTIIPLVIYRVKQQAKFFILLSLTRVFIQFAIVYYLIVIKKMGVLGSYYGQLIPLLMYFVISWLIIYKNAIFNINTRQIKEALKFTLPLLPGALSYLIMSISDRIILERSVSLSLIGIYNVAVTIALSLNIIIQSGYRALEPEIFRRFNDSSFTMFMTKTKNVFLFFVLLTALILALFSQEVFYFFTSPKFYEGYKLIPLILLGVIMMGYNVIYGSILTAEKNSKAIGFSTIIGGACSISINLIFIPHFGVYAAIVSSAISFLIMNIYCYTKIKVNKSYQSEMFAYIIYFLITTIFLITTTYNYSTRDLFIKIPLLIIGVTGLILVFKIPKLIVFRKIKLT